MIKKKKKASPQQKSRAKYKCPPELEELIYQANLVPIGTITPDFEYEIREEIKRLREENVEPSPEISAYEFLTNLIKHLPKEFLEHIKNLAASRTLFGEGFPDDEARFMREFVKQYIKYWDMRGSMIWFVQRLETERQMMRDAEKSRQLKEGSITFQVFNLLDWDAFPLSVRTVLKRDNKGKLHTTGLAALIGKFDDSRLRRCVIESCQKIFWAKRENSKTCSPRCLNVFNVRNSRSLTGEEKAERKAKRESNRELIKKGMAKTMKRSKK